ncbi:MAG: ABC transporter substrate-binding protein [Pseudomonadota bacterium]
MKGFLKRSAIILFFSLLALALAEAQGFSQVIKVGVILPLSGRLENFGNIGKKSFLMAADEINNTGGIHGKKIELIVEDTKGMPGTAYSAVEKLFSQDKVVAIVGGYSSSATWASIGLAQQHKIPFLVSTASADKISEQGWDYVFRLTSPASEHTKTFESFVRQVDSIKTVAILHENTLFGEFWLKKFIKQCLDLGLKVVIRESYEPGAADFRTILAKVKNKEPDLIHMISSVTEASLLIRQSKELELNSKIFLGNDVGFTHPDFHKNGGTPAEYVCSATIWSPSVPYPRAQEYYERFAEKYDLLPDYHGAQAYAGMYVIADALKRAKSLSHKEVRDTLEETDIMTIFGPIKFISYGKKRRQNRIPNYMVQWLNGKIETVWPKDVATANFVFPRPKWIEQ